MKAQVYRIMEEQMRDPVFAKSLRSARKSHPNFLAMVANLGLSDSDVAQWERIMDEDFSENARAAALSAKDAAIATLEWGQRVVAVGLSTEWLNGATCSVASAYDSASGRYILRVHDPPETVRKCGGVARLKRENLECQTWSRPRVDAASHWVDEFGWVCCKSIKYGQQCPRSHDVVCKDATRPESGVCSVCDEHEASDVWSCCGGCGYNVCVRCRAELMHHHANDLVPPPATTANERDFPMLVSCGVPNHVFCFQHDIIRSLRN
jgi:hypothetical protein